MVGVESRCICCGSSYQIGKTTATEGPDDDLSIDTLVDDFCAVVSTVFPDVASTPSLLVRSLVYFLSIQTPDFDSLWVIAWAALSLCAAARDYRRKSTALQGSVYSTLLKARLWTRCLTCTVSSTRGPTVSAASKRPSSGSTSSQHLISTYHA